MSSVPGIALKAVNAAGEGKLTGVAVVALD